MQQILRKLHLWLGLTAGAFVLMMSVSGCLIIFRGNIESLSSPLALPLRTAVPAAAMPRWTAVEIQLAALQAHITRITIPQESTDPLVIQAETKDKQKMDLLADQSSGRLLGVKRKLAWLDFIVDLHQNLLLGKRGRALTGIIGIALLLLSVSGVASWLQGRRDWKAALLLPQRGPWRRVNYELHKWGGLWANLFLVVVSSTGIVLAVPDTLQSLGVMKGEPKPLRVQHEVAAQLLPIGEYVRLAEATVPDGVVREVRMPARGRDRVAIVLWAPGDIRPKGGNTVSLDATSGRVFSMDRLADAPFSTRFVEYANAIHKVEWGGWLLKTPWALLGFAPVLLFASGIQIWWHQRNARLRAAAHAHLAQEAESVVH